MIKVISFKGETFGFEITANFVELVDGADGAHAHFVLDEEDISGLDITVPHTSPDYQRFKDAVLLYTLAK